MQFKVLSALAFVTLAAATVLPARWNDPTPASQCNTGDLQCCQSVQSASSPSVASLLTLLGVVVGSVTAPVGLTCSAISVIGLGSSSCSAQPVCCTNNSFNGAVALGCSPVNLNL